MEYHHHHHHHHHQHDKQELELMTVTSNTNPSSTRRIESLNEEDEGGGVHGGGLIEREHMFDKVVTPSDVGKLNRLVIPKLHAEKYFPLDSSNNEKGLLLNFEDRTGKPWRFRYSYWNSSQSYVMTKGWSRFVKEKKLYAGDIVSFQRGVGNNNLFIDWRRRVDDSSLHGRVLPHTAWGPNSRPGFILHSHHLYPVWNPQNVSSSPSYHHHNPIQRGLDLGSTGSGGGYGYGLGYGLGYGYGYGYELGLGNVVNPYPVYESVPVVQGNKVAANKRLRLFGVNMECPISHQTHDFDILSSSLPSSSSTLTTHHRQQQQHIEISTGLDSGSSSPYPSWLGYNGTTSSSVPIEKGKSSTSSSMSLDLDI